LTEILCRDKKLRTKLDKVFWWPKGKQQLKVTKKFVV